MSPFAAALEEFKQSETWKRGTDPLTLRAPEDQRRYLENRIHNAFEAGWNACEAKRFADNGTV